MEPGQLVTPGLRRSPGPVLRPDTAAVHLIEEEVELGTHREDHSTRPGELIQCDGPLQGCRVGECAGWKMGHGS